MREFGNGCSAVARRHVQVETDGRCASGGSTGESAERADGGETRAVAVRCVLRVSRVELAARTDEAAQSKALAARCFVETL